MKRCLVGTVYAGLAMAVVGCGGAARGTGERGELNPNREVAVTVRNENFYDATIYVCRGSSRDRLGVVQTSQTRDFKFSWISADIRFLIDFVGAGAYITESMLVATGDQLQLLVTLDLDRGVGNARCI